jgi:hypothetical protein
MIQSEAVQVFQIGLCMQRMSQVSYLTIFSGSLTPVGLRGFCKTLKKPFGGTISSRQTQSRPPSILAVRNIYEADPRTLE